MRTKSKLMGSVIKALTEEQSYEGMCHADGMEVPMPSVERLREIVGLCREIIFPGYFGDTPLRPESVQFYMGVNVEKMADLLNREIYAGLCFSEDCDTVATLAQKAEDMTMHFVEQLPELRRLLRGDVEAIYYGDPAAKSTGEIIFSYPGIKAILNYRIAHAMHKLGVPLIPRVITEMAHSETGIDIHPMAQIGERFAIDHGTGVVIGATSIIGNNVKIYQGVTLGAKSFPSDENGNPIKGIARHPIIEDNVVIYAQATILGRVTIGANSVIGGNVWITENIPAGSKILQKL
jgi:serine O-acetyltransferase